MQDGRAPRVKNRAAAAVQITAEQLLREAQERQETAFRAPKQRVEDFEELNEYRGRKRKEFEERIRRTRGNLCSYASWEASQGEYERSRSVYERALDCRRTERPTMAVGRNVQHARNLFDRAVTLLPRIDQLWYKYVYLEELLGNVPGARQVFERWMQWEPEDKAWQAYIKMEERYQELDRASAIYERWVAVRPEPRVWVKWAKFEEERVKLDKAREVFQTALEFFGDDAEQIEKAQAVFNAFAKMETRLKEYERARVIFKFALERLPRSKSSALYAAYTKFEKQHGTRTTLETTVIGKRRIQYEEELTHDGRNYDVWFDYARLEEGAVRTLKEEDAADDEVEAAVGRVREIYERAVAQVPPGELKRHWRRYIFLWLDYALFEEIETKIYRTVLQVVPHKQFTFAKLWLMFARFEVRRIDLPAARKLLGAAIGMCPKEKLFKDYIQLELDLREFDRVRTLYEKYIEFDPTNSSSWIQFAQFEAALADYSRARAIFELGIGQTPLSYPENLWKAYIDFEFEQGEREKTRALYERLVALSGHVKVWRAYAESEAAPIPMSQALQEEEEEDENDQEKFVEGDLQLARQVFERGYKDLKSKGLKEERVVLLDGWKEFEQQHGSESDVEKVQAMMPIVSRKQRKVDEFGDNLEEYWDMVFPDDEREANPASFKFLEMAHKWKRMQAAGTGSSLLAAAKTAVPASRLSPPKEGEDSDEEMASSTGGD
ncbi:pre-mRNA-splicing factor CLF1 [Phellopilus nigrolimitatus]|nr:pre-mRNA-splicing factor CLF1 [Phellopilus nigrolimitatus]